MTHLPGLLLALHLTERRAITRAFDRATHELLHGAGAPRDVPGLFAPRPASRAPEEWATFALRDGTLLSRPIPVC